MNLINRPPPISPYSACRHAENSPTSAIITGTLLASTGGPAIPESKPAMVADRTAAAGAHGVDMSPAFDRQLVPPRQARPLRANQLSPHVPRTRARARYKPRFQTPPTRGEPPTWRRSHPKNLRLMRLLFV